MRELFWRFKPTRWLKFRIEAGILPVMELKDRSTQLSWGEREEGILPEKLLF